MNNQDKGFRGEQEFMKMCNSAGVPYDYLDSWVEHARGLQQ